MSSTQPLQSNQIVQDQVEKEKFAIFKYVNSPWIIVGAIITAGLIYLLWHPDLIKIGINNPWAVATIGGFVAAFFLIKLLQTFFSAITRWINLRIDDLKKENSENRFFGFVITMFILASVLESGPFFASIQKQELYGILGYLIILVFDLSAIRFMQARKKALAHGNEKQARTYTLGVWITAIVSAFANASSSLEAYASPTDGKTPPFMTHVAPWTGVIFPIMIVFLSYTIDADVDGKTAVEKYKDGQQLKLDLLKAKREMITKLSFESAQIALIEQKAFALKNLLFTNNKFLLVIEQVTIKVREAIDGELKASRAELQEAQSKLANHITTIEELVQTAENNKQLIIAAQTQIAADRQYIEGSLSAVQQQDYSVLIADIVNRDFPKLLSSALNNYLPSIVDTLKAEMQNKISELGEQQRQLIDTRFNDVAKTTVVQLTESLQRDMQFQITTKFEQAMLQAPTITEITGSIDQGNTESNEVEAKTSKEKITDPHNEQIEARTPKGFGYAMTDDGFQLDGVTFARTEAIVKAFDIDNLTEDMLRSIALHGLVDPVHFKYIRTTGWGNTYYRLMTEVSPNVKKLIAQAVINHGEML